MIQALCEPELLDLGGGRRRLVRPVIVELHGRYLCTIPEGFESDGMSFPWWSRLTWDDPWHERYALAALLHDYLLERDKLAKRYVDWLFLGALLSAGVPALEAGVFWLAVRAKRSRT